MESTVAEIDPLTEFFDAIRNPLTKRAYEKRLGFFFDYLKIEGDLRAQARIFERKAKFDLPWATKEINEYMRSKKLGVEQGKISESTLPNFYKPIHLFCDQNDIVLNWKKISKRIPKGRSRANDRLPELREIKHLLQHSDRRVGIAVLVMLSSGCRVGAFASLNWGHIEAHEKNHVLLAAKVKIYPGTSSEYFTFITPECYNAIKDYIDFRAANGEKIGRDSPVLRNLFPPEKGAKGEPHKPVRLTYDAVRNLVYSALVETGLRKGHVEEGKKRHEFSGDHSFRKFFTTLALKHTSSLNVQILRGDDTGLMESYNRPTEEYLLGEYLKVVSDLTILEPRPQIISEDFERLEEKIQQQGKDIEALTVAKEKDSKELKNLKEDIEELVLYLGLPSEKTAGKNIDQRVRSFIGSRGLILRESATINLKNADEVSKGSADSQKKK